MWHATAPRRPDNGEPVQAYSVLTICKDDRHSNPRSVVVAGQCRDDIYNGTMASLSLLLTERTDKLGPASETLEILTRLLWLSANEVQ
jgi:hypothetical protein